MASFHDKTSNCEFCGTEYSRTCVEWSYIGNNCFDCSFWLGKMKMSSEDENKRVIVNGQHYMIENDDAQIYRGFGGRKFNILFHDGRMVESSNLWCQGEIPERFRKWLPENAVFLQADKEEQMIHTTKGGAHGLV